MRKRSSKQLINKESTLYLRRLTKELNNRLNTCEITGGAGIGIIKKARFVTPLYDGERGNIEIKNEKGKTLFYIGPFYHSGLEIEVSREQNKHSGGNF